MDLHIHDTDFVLDMLGQPENVESRVTEDYSGPVHIFSLMTFPGFVVSLEGGWNYPSSWGFQMAFQAIYEHAVLDYDSRNGQGLTICESNGEPVPMKVSKPEAGSSTSGEGNLSELGGYYNQLLYFTECVRNGEPPQKATLQDGRASLELCLREIRLGQAANKTTTVLG